MGGTLPPVFAGDETTVLSEKVTGRSRPANTARPICKCFCFQYLGTMLKMFFKSSKLASHLQHLALHTLRSRHQQSPGSRASN